MRTNETSGLVEPRSRRNLQRSGTGGPRRSLRNQFSIISLVSTWRGARGRGCGQYAAGADNTWRSTCNVDHAVVSPEMVAQSTDMFDLTVQGQTTSEACPVSCGTCPACDDRIQNGDEIGVDCGGSCAVMCDPNATCEPFAESRFVQPNSDLGHAWRTCAPCMALHLDHARSVNTAAGHFCCHHTLLQGRCQPC
eukprot:SAG11_NODE_6699_length_1263_cov_2.807560_1_plen_193_part_10